MAEEARAGAEAGLGAEVGVGAEVELRFRRCRLSQAVRQRKSEGLYL